MPDSLEFTLLGPLEVRRNGARVDVGPNKRRLLMIRLLLENGQLVSADQLCEDIWEGGLTRVSSLHSHISRLRSALEPTRSPRAKDGILISRPRGYALLPPPGSLDVHRFTGAVQRARELMRIGKADEARREVETGLRLWRGEALSDAKEHAFAAHEAERLERTRQEAQELQAEAMIAQGDLYTAIQAAGALTEAQPLRERGWGLQIRALYLAGRAGEALQTFEHFRRFLAENLGLDPSPGMRELHLAVLRHDAATIGGSIPTADVRTATTTVQATNARNLQNGATDRELVGRARDLASLEELLNPAKRNRGRFAVVYGGEGMGKTRLAEEFTEQAAAAGHTIAWGRCAPRLGTLRAATDLGPLLDIQAQLGVEETEPVRVPHPRARTRRDTYFLVQQRVAADMAARRIARAMASGPVVCVIEDLHRAGRRLLHAISLLATLCRDLPCVLVCTTQESDNPLLIELLGSLAQQGATQIALEPLSPEEVRAVVALHHGGASPEVAEALHQRTDGNPFLLSEVMKLPHQQQVGPTAVVPPAVIRVFHARLSWMSAPVRTMLHTAASCGASLDIPALARFLNTSPEALCRMSDIAVQAGFLVHEPALDGALGSGCAYRFGMLAREILLSEHFAFSRDRRLSV